MRLPRDTFERLRELSALKGCPVSDMAKDALARGLTSDDAAAAVRSTLTRDLKRGAQRQARPRKLSRIERAARATAELRRLLEEYTAWLESLPEFVEGSATAIKLETAIEELEMAVEALERLDLPRGFGRD
jgi:hypothetical protein